MIAGASRPKLRPLPQVDVAAHHAWREGWWQGIAIGVVIGLAVAVIFAR